MILAPRYIATKPVASVMSTAGLCAICEQREAIHSCRQCGAIVCDRHFNRDQALCTDCAAMGSLSQ